MFPPTLRSVASVSGPMPIVQRHLVSCIGHPCRLISSRIRRVTSFTLSHAGSAKYWARGKLPCQRSIMTRRQASWLDLIANEIASPIGRGHATTASSRPYRPCGQVRARIMGLI